MEKVISNGARHPVAIVGAGLAGALLACYLGRTGRAVDVYEKRPDPRSGPEQRGRSINLALSVRGIHALKEVGLVDEVLANSVLMHGRMIHAIDGSLNFQPYGKDDTEALQSVSRSGLNRLLVEGAARYPSVRFSFNQRCLGIDPFQRTVELFDESARTPAQAEAEAIIGTDGAYSAVRAWMQKREGFNYQQDYLSHGYKELSIPAESASKLERHALHIWPRGNFMMIALPNLDGSFTCTLFWPMEGANSFASLKTEREVLPFFRSQFLDAVPMIPDLAKEFLNNPIGGLVTIRCQPWSVGKAVLVGDACHAVVPFLGQGMNAAFEDCTVLYRCLAEEKWGWEGAFRRYEELRKKHVDALADLCIANFVEMRDSVASPWFVLRKRMAILLHGIFPRWYLPLYTMIEFTRIPYADAVRRAQTQGWVITATSICAVLLAIFLSLWLWAH
jgi:kynurenine 3-monooxygenase